MYMSLSCVGAAQDDEERLEVKPVSIPRCSLSKDAHAGGLPVGPLL